MDIFLNTPTRGSLIRMEALKLSKFKKITKKEKPRFKLFSPMNFSGLTNLLLLLDTCNHLFGLYKFYKNQYCLTLYQNNVLLEFSNLE